MNVLLSLQFFAQEAAPETDAQNNEAAAPAQDASDTVQEGEAAAPPPAATEPPPEGKQAEPAPKSPGQENAGLLAGVAAAMEAGRRNSALKQIVSDWEQSAEALREIYPGFDLKREARENGEFARLLQAGVSVRRAYEAANLEEILGEAMRYAVRTAGKKAAESMRSQSGRVQENSVLDRASSLGKKDVDSLTKADILKILDEVSRGAKIKF